MIGIYLGGVLSGFLGAVLVALFVHALTSNCNVCDSKPTSIKRQRTSDVLPGGGL